MQVNLKFIMQVRAFSIKNKNQDLKIQTLKMTNQQCCRISVLCQTSKKKKKLDARSLGKQPVSLSVHKLSDC